MSKATELITIRQAPTPSFEVGKMTNVDILNGQKEVVEFLEIVESTLAEAEVAALEERTKLEVHRYKAKSSIYEVIAETGIKTNEEQRDLMVYQELQATPEYVSTLSELNIYEQGIVRLKALNRSYNRYLTLYHSLLNMLLNMHRLRDSKPHFREDLGEG